MDEEIRGSDGCSTPERWECRIPAALVPPPPPKKKPFSFGKKKKKQWRPSTYFQPCDLEELFSLLPRPQKTCV
ncbi:hypothetical protein HN51_010102 [Arachis hypogaea]|nr:uncharacterized protein DS421_3g62540 [Arachis hypogaea]